MANTLARQLFPHACQLQVNRVATGVSTWVYSIHLNGACYFLRVLPEVGASFAPEVSVHTRLRAAGLHVPEVIYFEPQNELFARSVMVTTEIRGAPLESAVAPEAMAGVLRAAGRELAILNQVVVDGFGWVARDVHGDSRLYGEADTCRTWMQAEVETLFPVLVEQAWLTPAELELLAGHVARAQARLDTNQATLAHGDFDTTHIFHEGGRYTGMIDFGEIRGTHRLYDLGHFAIEHAHLLPPLLAGYREITVLSDDEVLAIEQAACLVAVARVARRLAHKRSVLAADRQVILRALSTSF